VLPNLAELAFAHLLPAGSSLSVVLCGNRYHLIRRMQQYRVVCSTITWCWLVTVEVRMPSFEPALLQALQPLGVAKPHKVALADEHGGSSALDTVGSVLPLSVIKISTNLK
jgi:hypothetical protein